MNLFFKLGILFFLISGFSIIDESQKKELSENSITLKPEIKGLVSMGYVGGILRHRGRNGGESDGNGSSAEDLDDVFSKPGIFGGAVLNLSWKELEPGQGKLTTDVIDVALNRVRKYNKKNPETPLLLRLRVSCGRAAPDWAKSTGGKPVHILDPKGNYFYIGRFWTEGYRQAWRSFQDRLAAIYDSEPLIADVTVTSGMTNSDENMNLATNTYSLNNMHAGGFSDSLFVDVIENAGEDYAAWRHTRLCFLINPFRFTDSGEAVFCEEFTLSLMKYFKEKYGDRTILSNHSYQYPETERLKFIYYGIRNLGGAFDYQTHAPNGVDMDSTVIHAAELGASTIELWNAYVNYPDEVLWRWKKLFDDK